jgi:hypothetical protein
MAIVRATSRYPLECCQSLEVWYRGHSCPESGSGQRLVHKWILPAANACKHFGLPIEEAHTWIEERMSREPDSNREIPDTLAYVYGSEAGTFTGTRTPKPKHEPFKPDKLREAIAQVDVPDPVQYLRNQSPLPVDIRPSQYLRAITEPGEFRIAVPRQEACGADVRLWRNPEPAIVLTNADKRVDELTEGSALGAWFLNNPVDGVERDGSYRRTPNVTVWRFSVIETDEDITSDDWLRFLITLPFPIVSITHSGCRGAHALVRTNTSTKEELGNYIKTELMPLTVYGADPNSLEEYRLTRLPNCWRGQKNQRQTLYCLNPSADGSPIFQRKRESE